MKRSRPTTNTKDRDIREPLISWIASRHPADGSTGIIQEFEMPRPSARIDLAVVNGEMSGFEIKSDADTLIRLRSQVPAFSRFFDKVSLVTTQRHLPCARKMIPEWWGIMVFKQEGAFRVVRSAKQNRNTDVSSLLFALTKAEIVEIAQRAGLKMRISQKKADMTGSVVIEISESDLFVYARDIIRKRTDSVILQGS